MEKVKVGIAGLGRLGKVHANNIAYKIPNAELTAACSIMPAELEYAQKELGVKDVYTDFDEMLAKADIDAVAIVTTSGLHCSQIAKALDAGKHVFSEKSLGVNVEACKQAEVAVERHPELSFFLGFMRRFDPSYAYAMEKIKAGLIGEPYMVKATGIDPEALVQGAIRFAPTSGGIFIDMAIHDIDLMRWFLGEDPVEVYASGRRSSIRNSRLPVTMRRAWPCTSARAARSALSMSGVQHRTATMSRRRLSARKARCASALSRRRTSA